MLILLLLCAGLDDRADAALQVRANLDKLDRFGCRMTCRNEVADPMFGDLSAEFARDGSRRRIQGQNDRFKWDRWQDDATQQQIWTDRKNNNETTGSIHHARRRAAPQGDALVFAHLAFQDAAGEDYNYITLDQLIEGTIRASKFSHVNEGDRRVGHLSYENEFFHRELWLDPAHGYLPFKSMTKSKDPRESDRVEWNEVNKFLEVKPGVWFPEEMKAYSVVRRVAKPGSLLKLSGFHFGETASAHVRSFRFPTGMLILDAIKSLEFTADEKGEATIPNLDKAGKQRAVSKTGPLPITKPGTPPPAVTQVDPTSWTQHLWAISLVAIGLGVVLVAWRRRRERLAE